MGDERRRQQPQPVLQRVDVLRAQPVVADLVRHVDRQRRVGRQPVRVADVELVRPRIGLVQSIR